MILKCFAVVSPGGSLSLKFQFIYLSPISSAVTMAAFLSSNVTAQQLVCIFLLHLGSASSPCDCTHSVNIFCCCARDLCKDRFSEKKS